MYVFFLIIGYLFSEVNLLCRLILLKSKFNEI